MAYILGFYHNLSLNPDFWVDLRGRMIAPLPALNCYRNKPRKVGLNHQPVSDWILVSIENRMASSNRAKVPTPKQLSSVGVKKDEFETFWHILLTYCQQDLGYLDFLKEVHLKCGKLLAPILPEV